MSRPDRSEHVLHVAGARRFSLHRVVHLGDVLSEPTRDCRVTLLKRAQASANHLARGGMTPRRDLLPDERHMLGGATRLLVTSPDRARRRAAGRPLGEGLPRSTPLGHAGPTHPPTWGRYALFAIVALNLVIQAAAGGVGFAWFPEAAMGVPMDEAAHLGFRLAGCANLAGAALSVALLVRGGSPGPIAWSNVVYHALAGWTALTLDPAGALAPLRVWGPPLHGTTLVLLLLGLAAEYVAGRRVSTRTTVQTHDLGPGGSAVRP